METAETTKREASPAPAYEIARLPRPYIWDSVDWANMCLTAVCLSGDLARGERQLERWLDRWGY